MVPGIGIMGNKSMLPPPEFKKEIRKDKSVKWVGSTELYLQKVDQVHLHHIEIQSATKSDKNIEEMKYTETNPNTKNFGRLYYKNKKQMALDSRDYDEKVFTVWEGNKLYRYSSSNYEK